MAHIHQLAASSLNPLLAQSLPIRLYTKDGLYRIKDGGTPVCTLYF